MKIVTYIFNFFRSRKNKSERNKETQEAMLPAMAKQIAELDPIETVLKDSKQRLNKLKIYVGFFDNKTITDIYNQTEIVHDVFAGNKELNHRKLEQYHYYYTEHLIELLQKLKKSKEENIAVITSQLKSIDNKISTTKAKVSGITQGDTKKLNNTKHQYAQYMSLQLASIYNCLVEKFDDFRFKKHHNLVTYTNDKGTDTAWTIPSNVYMEVTQFKTDSHYKWDEYCVERKLMGKLQKELFNVDFIGICMSGDSSFELFKISESGDHFIYIHALGIFKFVEFRKIQGYCTETNTKLGVLSQEIDDLQERRNELKAKMSDVRVLDTKVEQTLKDYLKKIEDIELINQIAETDVEQRNLKSIMELTRLEV